jgi:hypothetical protein
MNSLSEVIAGALSTLLLREEKLDIALMGSRSSS